MILWVLGVEVGTQNRAKIDQNLKPKLKCLLASIFDRFWCTWGGKLVRKSIENQPKIDQKSVLEGSWGAFGSSWRPRPKMVGGNPFFGPVLGPSWGRLGAVLALGSPSWAVLGHPGVVLGRLKIDVKIDQKIDAFQNRILMRCWWIWGREMEASWHWNGI